MPVEAAIRYQDDRRQPAAAKDRDHNSYVPADRLNSKGNNTSLKFQYFIDEVVRPKLEAKERQGIRPVVLVDNASMH